MLRFRSFPKIEKPLYFQFENIMKFEKPLYFQFENIMKFEKSTCFGNFQQSNNKIQQTHHFYSPANAIEQLNMNISKE